MFHSLSGKSCHLLCDCLFKQSNRPIRGIKFLKKKGSGLSLDKSHHKVVYDYRWIILPAAVVKTKVWMPPCGVLAAPFLYLIDGTISSPIICLLTACVYGSTGVLLSKLTENMVGKIYVNKEGDVKDVIISSLNKRGQRIDRVHHVNDLINYDFPNVIQRSLGFITIGVEKSTTVYKLNVRDCKLIDPGMCRYLFGNIWHVNIKENKTDSKTRSESENAPGIR